MLIKPKKATKSATSFILSASILFSAVFMGTVHTAALSENKSPSIYEENYKKTGIVREMIGVGEKSHMIKDFSDYNSGKVSFTLTSGSDAGHYNFSLVSESSDFSGGADADYLQFEINNTSEQKLQIFYLNIIGTDITGNCKLQLKSGVKCELYDFNTRLWSEKTTDSYTELYGEIPSLSVDSKFYGIDRKSVV